MSWDKKTFLTEKSKESRIAALSCINGYGSGHVGGAMSIIETLVVLYYDVMRKFNLLLTSKRGQSNIIIQ